VPGHAVDPSYLEVSESTGGELFLFQKSDLAQAGPALSASNTHPATILRAVGHLNANRSFEFPVDSTVESLLLVVSIQCRDKVVLSRPSGEEMTDRNSALNRELAAGKIVQVDHPEPGTWRVQLTGTGLFILSVRAISDLRIAGVAHDPVLAVPQVVQFRMAGQPSRAGVQLVDASAGRISELRAADVSEDGSYRASVTSQAERYRVVVTGEDRSAWPFQRVYPVLFRVRRSK
jgi:hypothetical protein